MQRRNNLPFPKTPMKRLCIYCGSSSGSNPKHRQAATDLGTLLASMGIGIVYGGGRVGLMGILADAALCAGGEVIGVIPHSLMERELGHPTLSELRVVASMHERKQLMADLSDGFIALPGGIGTLEELFETFTWLQLGFHAKPVSLLNSDGFFTHLLEFLQHASNSQFLHPTHHDLLIVDHDAPRLLERMSHFCPDGAGIGAKIACQTSRPPSSR
ncbi:MAG: hypothetical protein RIS92_1024 [Verrucomicrobiota bacterium]